LIAVGFSLLAFTLAGCDFGARAERMRADQARALAEAERERAEVERKHAQAQQAELERENARLRAELDEARKLLGKDVEQDDWLEQTGDFSAVTGIGTFVISYRRVYARVPELTFPKPELDPGGEVVSYEVTDRRTDGFTIKVNLIGSNDKTATMKKYKWVAKGVPAPKK
jgi:multidrug efflux pump subunit AcrA (membrane-fusion protein)